MIRTASTALAAALAKLGLLRGGPDGLGAALSIDRLVVRFREASWSPVGDAIDLTLRAEPGDLAGVRSRLDAVDGDSQVILQLRCGQEDDNAATPSATFGLATQPGQASNTLKEETRRQFALRVPVRPTAQPSLNVSIRRWFLLIPLMTANCRALDRQIRSATRTACCGRARSTASKTARTRRCTSRLDRSARRACSTKSCRLPRSR